MKQTLENIKQILGPNCITDGVVPHNGKSYLIYKSFKDSVYCVTSNDGIMGPILSDRDEILNWINSQ